MDEAQRPVRFERVLNEEVDLIARARAAYGIATEPIEPSDDDARATSRARSANLCGLALSGGGIRSATFNLGMIQALSRHRLLGRCDYLSTVSGGGYIGAWLTAWIHRHTRGVHGVQQEMREALLGSTPEPREIGWLRDYSNYLMLRLGYLSGDSWATVAIYLRNLWLNVTLIIACLGFALLLPRLLIHGLNWIPGLWYGPLGVAFMSIAIGSIIVNLDAADGKFGWLRSQPGVMLTIVMPGLVSSLLLAHAMIVDFPGAWRVRELGLALWPQLEPMHMPSWILAGALVYTFPWLSGAMASIIVPGPPGSRFRWDSVVLFAPFAGALIGWLCYGYSEIAREVAIKHWEASSWLITGFGPPVLLGILSFALVLHIGLVSRGFSEDIREWWGRLGGWSTLAAIAWALGFAVVIYAPAVVKWAGDWMAAIGLGWFTTTILGVLLGRTASTSVIRPGRVLDWITALLPFVFVAGLVIAVAVGVHAALAPDAPLCLPPRLDGDEKMNGFLDDAAVVYCELALTHIDELGIWMLSLAALAFLLQLRVDVNVFSLGPLYRNRLLRCYLGASRQSQRRPHAFTGFDRKDDLALSDLAGPATSAGPSRPQRPYPIVNTAINLTTGQKLAWQQRKAGSFVFSPLYCGYQMPDEGGTRWSGRYCATLDYVSGPVRAARRGSIALSNAVTISGAAASPNAGYHSSPTVAFLLTVFSVRLGSWFQNPRKPQVWREPGPAHSLKPLLSELFGLSNDRSDFVYLSDGGHFENLGIYELVRRRCRFVIACDAGCDPRSTFEDLGNAIRKCRIDLGVDIEIDTSALLPRAPHGRSEHYCALGLLRYDRINPHAGVGYLLYIKAAVCGNEPQDVTQYRNEHPGFPHQTTADQFFDEPQFESYRRLGLHIGDMVLGAACARARAGEPRIADPARDLAGADIDLERLFKELRARWYPSLALPEGAFTRHTEALDRILDRIRSDDRLRFLDRQLHPEWAHLEHGVGADAFDQPWLPDDVDALRSAFYLCEQIIQLMESVYIDVALETTYDHPDNRGWMNLFRRFSAAGMMRITWAISAATYGARFQSFCEHHLGLNDSRIEQQPAVTVRDALAGGRNRNGHSLEYNVIRALNASAEITDSDEVVRFELMVGGALSAPPGQKAFGFPVAFAILRPPVSGAGNYGLRYLRVADHLQRMGLGWRVTSALLETHPSLELNLASRSPELRSAGSDADRSRFVRLFRAAKRISSRASSAPAPQRHTADPARGTRP